MPISNGTAKDSLGIESLGRFTMGIFLMVLMCFIAVTCDIASIQTTYFLAKIKTTLLMQLPKAALRNLCAERPVRKDILSLDTTFM